MASKEGIITNIQAYSLHDGPGIRTLVFLKGCQLGCEWCCNPECQKPGIEVEFYYTRCIKCGACSKVCNQKAINEDVELKSGVKVDKKICNDCGDCVRACPKGALKFIGKIVSVDEVLEEVKKDRYFFFTSKGGLTVSGGEALCQHEFTRELLKKGYESNIDTALETCGYSPWSFFEEVLPYLNLIIFDIKHMDPIKHKQKTGVSNEIIQSNLLKLTKKKVPILIRLPLIPHFNIDENNIRQTARYISNLESVREISLMPFHQFAKDKYFRLCRRYSLKDLIPLGKNAKGLEKIEAIRRIFESNGMRVSIG